MHGTNMKILVGFARNLETFESSLANDADLRRITSVCALSSFCHVFRPELGKTSCGQSANRSRSYFLVLLAFEMCCSATERAVRNFHM